MRTVPRNSRMAGLAVQVKKHLLAMHLLRLLDNPNGWLYKLSASLMTINADDLHYLEALIRLIERKSVRISTLPLGLGT